MEISKSSWHYRLMSFFDMKIPNSLCPYFWKSVACHLLILVATVVVTAILWAVLYLGGLMQLYPNIPNGMDPISFTFTLTAAEHFRVIWHSLLWDIGFVGVILTGVYCIVRDFREFVHGLFYNSKIMDGTRKHEDYDDYIYEKRWAKREKKPSLILEYLKARKTKICPILEFKD